MKLCKIKAKNIALTISILSTIVAILYINANQILQTLESLPQVGFSYWGGGIDFPYAIKIKAAIKFDIPIAMFYLAIIYSIGKIACEKIFKEIQEELYVRPAAILLTGYLLIIAFIRLISIIATPVQTASALFIFGVIAIAFVVKDIHRTKYQFQLWPIGFVLIAIAEIQTGGVHILGDGHSYFLNLIEIKGMEPPRWPVIFSQQYDDFMFAIPTLFGPLKLKNPLISWWLAFTILKFASIQLVYGAAIKLKCSAKQALAVALFIFFNYGNLTPISHSLSFDAGPWLFGVSSGSRVFAIALTIYLLAKIYSEQGAITPRPTALSQYAILPMMGVGLSAISPSIYFALLLLIFAKVTAPTEERYDPIKLMLPLLASTLSIILMMMWIEFKQYSHQIIIVTGFFIAIPTLFALIKIENKFNIVYLIRNNASILIAGGISSLALGGVLLVRQIPQYFLDAKVVDRLQFGGLIGKNQFALGEIKFCDQFPITFCETPSIFLNYYGFPYFLAVAAIIATINNRHRYLIATCLFAYTVAIWILLFTNGENFKNDIGVVNIWTKTRIPELFYFTTIAISLITLIKSSSYFFKSTTILMITAYIGLQTFHFTESPIAQFLRNTIYLLKIFT